MAKLLKGRLKEGETSKGAWMTWFRDSSRAWKLILTTSSTTILSSSSPPPSPNRYHRSLPPSHLVPVVPMMAFATFSPAGVVLVSHRARKSHATLPLVQTAWLDCCFKVSPAGMCRYSSVLLNLGRSVFRMFRSTKHTHTLKDCWYCPLLQNCWTTPQSESISIGLGAALPGCCGGAREIPARSCLISVGLWCF